MELFNTPILLIVFNRPETTLKVLRSIKMIKPTVIYISADGPRYENLGDEEKCATVKRIIEEEIDWNCKIYKSYQTKNLGCGKAVSSAITWFFDNVEQGIILEDDCVPNISFFYFCETMLIKYKDDDRVFSITGQNMQFGHLRISESYFFSKYLFIWGWATWKRAWNKYDYEMRIWPKFKDTKLKYVLNGDVDQILYWEKVLDSFYKKEIDSWDYQFLLSMWQNSACTIVPSENLVTNIGFGIDATHTINDNSKLANLPTNTIDGLVSPKYIKINEEADNYFFYKVLNYREERTIIRKVFDKIKNICKVIVDINLPNK